MNEVVGCEAVIPPTSHTPPSAMARHALRVHEFKVLLRLLPQDPAVRVGSHWDLRRFLHGVHYLLRTGLPWRDLLRCFGHGHDLFRRDRHWCQVGSGSGWWRSVPPNGDNRVACTWPPPTCAPARFPPVPDVTRAACWPAAPTTCWRTELRR